MWFSALDLPSEKDLHKILQVLEPHVSFLEDLTKMGGAMRSVLTQVLTSQQFYKDLSSGMFVLFLIIKFSNYEEFKGINFITSVPAFFCLTSQNPEKCMFLRIFFCC